MPLRLVNNKKGLLLAPAILAIILSVFAFHTEAGIILWKLTKFPGPALLLNRNASFAVEIGNYYFNVYGNGAYSLKRAEHYFQKALELDPQVPDAWHQLARIDFLRGDFDEALKKINKQIALHGESFMASFYIRGLISGYAGNFSQAEDDFKRFLKWDPDNWAANNDLAWIYFRMGEYRKAEDAARFGLRENPGNPWLLISLGTSLLNQGDKKEAREKLLEAKSAVALLTESDWHKAYPGNDPRSAQKGLREMEKVIDRNLVLLN